MERERGRKDEIGRDGGLGEHQERREAVGEG